MIPLDKAFEIIDNAVTALSPKQIPIGDAVGCVAAENVVASINVPDFPCSSMDGYAVRYADLKGKGPWRMPVQAIAAAGEYDTRTLAPGQAIKIMTGAPLVNGADTIIPIEDVDIESGEAFISRKPAKGDFVRGAGDDIMAGDRLYRKGDIFDAISPGILASIGMTHVHAIPRPELALISTGSEIAEPGGRLKRGQIYDSNRALLESLLRADKFGAPSLIKYARDDRDDLGQAIGNCLNAADMIIATGGVSAGDYDLIPQTVTSLGGIVLFHKVAIKPGKPVLLGKIGDCWFLGLPGNPVSAVAGYHLFARRMISRLMNHPYAPRIYRAILGCDLAVTGDRYSIIGATLEKTDQGVIAYPAGRQSSGRLSTLKGVDCFIMVNGGERIIGRGTEIAIQRLWSSE